MVMFIHKDGVVIQNGSTSNLMFCMDMTDFVHQLSILFISMPKRSKLYHNKKAFVCAIIIIITCVHDDVGCAL